MATLLFKWLMIGTLFLALPTNNYHPIYVSVTEIEHNAKEKTLEISCKIFTDDFEKTLRQQYKTHVDLIDTKHKAAMENLVNDYVQKHLSIKVDGKIIELQFLGFEQQEEGIISFYQATNISSVKKLDIKNNILYTYKKEQMSIIHVKVNGERKSSKLLNPEEKLSFEF